MPDSGAAQRAEIVHGLAQGPEADPVIAWDKRIQAEGNRLPVYIGLPGLATLKALIGHARACGIGPSMRFLTRQARNVTKLLAVSAPIA